MPLFEESDPTVLAVKDFFGTTSLTPYRPITASGAPVAYLLGLGPVLPVYGPRQRTFGFAATPIGMRLNLLNRLRVQPTLAIDAGFVYSSRDVPIDYSSRFNFTVSMGPGLEILNRTHSSVRFEYLYSHMSNGGLGINNPAVDSMALRISVDHYRH